jgi:hypothetical protein
MFRFKTDYKLGNIRFIKTMDGQIVYREVIHKTIVRMVKLGRIFYHAVQEEYAFIPHIGLLYHTHPISGEILQEVVDKLKELNQTLILESENYAKNLS